MASNVDPTEDNEREAMVNDDGESKASSSQRNICKHSIPIVSCTIVVAKMAAVGRQLTLESVPSRPPSVINDRKEIGEVPLK